MIVNKHDRLVTQTVLNIVFVVLCILFLAPFILVVSISLSNEKDIILNGYSFFPKHIDLSAYEYVFNNPKSVINAYMVTIFTTVAGTALSVFLMSLMAYPLSRSSLKGRRGVSFYLFFTMLFNGGMAPTYILITQYLHLGDTLWVYILPGLINAWHVFLLRTFFSRLPESIVESAILDGAGEYKIFYSMILPLSKPVLATVALLGALARWNDWFTSMLYINKDNLVTLQYLLQKIMLNIQLMQQQTEHASMLMNVSDIPSETARMAMAVIAAGPMLLVFPFFQKYFVQGLTVGSVKG